jgi:hypothetical protein
MAKTEFRRLKLFSEKILSMKMPFLITTKHLVTRKRSWSIFSYYAVMLKTFLDVSRKSELFIKPLK